MRTRIKIDSATPDEVFAATLAFQRSSREHLVPTQLTMEPTVTVSGTRMGWESPALTAQHAVDLLAEIHRT